MKTEIFQDNIKTIKDDTIVGFQWIQSNHKGVIVQVGRTDFAGISLDLSTIGKWTKSSKEAYCQHSLSKNGEGGARIFKFDKIQELYFWLANPN